jgi:hypothetical protein
MSGNYTTVNRIISYKIPLPRWRELGRGKVRVEIAAHLSGARNDISFCRCEARSAEAISVGGITKHVGRPQRQYTHTSALMGGGTEESSVHSVQPPTLHCPQVLSPTATTVPSDLTPTVCQPPAATWTMPMPRQPMTLHCP